jgi:hypothetical protein
MEKFAEKKVWDNCNSVEFIPDMPGKRRMIWYLEAQQKAAEAHSALKQFREPVSAPVKEAVRGSQEACRARAVPVDKMPDVYDLFAEDGSAIGRGSVQQFRLSALLRAAAEKGDVFVTANWRKEFNGYEISSLQ